MLELTIGPKTQHVFWYWADPEWEMEPFSVVDSISMFLCAGALRVNVWPEVGCGEFNVKFLSSILARIS
jgi:hypothetical protein